MHLDARGACVTALRWVWEADLRTRVTRRQTTTLLGMAIALLVSTSLEFPNAILAVVDNQAQVAIGFLAGSVLVNVGMFRRNRGEGTCAHAYVLFVAYAAFLIAVSIVEAGYFSW